MEKQELKESRKRIGEKMKLMREYNGWSIEQVATMADMNPSTYEKIEAGLFSVPLDVLCKVAGVLGCQLTIKVKE